MYGCPVVAGGATVVVAVEVEVGVVLVAAGCVGVVEVVGGVAPGGVTGEPPGDVLVVVVEPGCLGSGVGGTRGEGGSTTVFVPSSPTTST